MVLEVVYSCNEWLSDFIYFVDIDSIVENLFMKEVFGWGLGLSSVNGR